ARYGAEVTALEADGAGVQVALADGTAVRAGIVLVAGGAGARSLVPALTVRVRAYPDRYLMADVPGPTDQPDGVAVITLDRAGVVESFPLPHGGRRFVAWDGRGMPRPAADGQAL